MCVLGVGSGEAVEFFVSSRRRHTRFSSDWSSDVCSSDLTTDFSITGYNTCLSYQSATTDEQVGKTEVRFTPEMELTFYGKSSRRVRDVAYRGGVSSRCKAALNHVRVGTINRLESAITDLVFQENSTAKVAVDSVEPLPSEGVVSGTSDQGSSLAEGQ